MSDTKEFHFAFEHFERDAQPARLWRVVFSTAADNDNAMVLTRYYSEADAQTEIDKLLTDKAKTVLSVDNYKLIQAFNPATEIATEYH